MHERLAAIDIGTNSVRLALGHMEGNVFLCDEKTLRTTRIGEDTITSDDLKPEPMRRTAQAVADFAREAEEAGARLLGAYATSAVREAPNKEAFLQICRDLGVEVEVLSGPMESAVAFYGCTQGKSGTYCVADIGGGSTELSFGTDGILTFGKSARVGAVRMREGFADDQGCMTDENREKLFCHLMEQLSPIAENLPKGMPLIGVGGTFTTLCAMDQRMEIYDPARVQDAVVTRESIKQFADTLCRTTLDERLAMAGLTAKRADIIPSAAVIAYAVLCACDAPSIIISDRDGLSGYAQAKVLGILDDLVK